MAAYLSVNERTFLKYVAEEDVLTGQHLRKPGGSATLPFHGPICLAEEIAFTDILKPWTLAGWDRSGQPAES